MTTPLDGTPTPASDMLAGRGFVVFSSPFSAAEVTKLHAAYDRACIDAAAADVRVGRTSTRVTDFVNRGPTFDSIYVWPQALDAARQVVGGPFRLSAFHARTLHPGAAAQELHVDVPRTSDAWPMLGLIPMVDEFRSDNGATRFVPGSHRWTASPDQVLADPQELVARPTESSCLAHSARYEPDMV